MEGRQSSVLEHLYGWFTRNAESEIKVERLEKFFAEVMALDHTELANRIRTDAATTTKKKQIDDLMSL